MNRKAVIIGDNPLGASVEADLRRRGFDVARGLEAVDADTAEVVLLSDETVPDPATADGAALAILRELAERASGRPRVHLMLRSVTSLTLLRRGDLAPALRDRLDIYPFNLDDEWSRSVVIDHRPIREADEHTAHLVIFGTSEAAELVAVNAALTAHFPNYIHSKERRTRITFVADDARRFMDEFTERYRTLMDHSYYRLVDASHPERPVRMVHKPFYSGSREDFVDVEWEFVEGNIYSPLVRRRLLQRAEDPRHVTSVVVAPAHGGDTHAVTTALNLPPRVLEALPVYVWTRSSALIDNIPGTRLRPIGMADSGYDTALPLVEMGMTVNYIYGEAYNDNIASSQPEGPDRMPLFAVTIDDERRAVAWQALGAVKRMSSIYNALTIPVKLRSVGISSPDDIERFYELSAHEIDVLAEVEHNRWSVEELLLGFRPCTPDEQRAVEDDISLKRTLRDRKVHYDLRAYNDLRDDATGKNVNIYDICLCGCLPLIARYNAPKQ